MRRRYEVEVEMDVDPIEEAQPSASEVAKWVTDRLRGAHCDVMERPLCVASFIEVSPNMTLNVARARATRNGKPTDRCTADDCDQPSTGGLCAEHIAVMARFGKSTEEGS